MPNPQEILEQIKFDRILNNLDNALAYQGKRMGSNRDPVYQIPFQAASKLKQDLRNAAKQFIQDQDISNFTSVCHYAIQEVKPIMDKRLTLLGKETAGSLYNINALEEMVDELGQNMSLTAKK